MIVANIGTMIYYEFSLSTVVVDVVRKASFEAFGFQITHEKRMISSSLSSPSSQ